MPTLIIIKYNVTKKRYLRVLILITYFIKFGIYENILINICDKTWPNCLDILIYLKFARATNIM